MGGGLTPAVRTLLILNIIFFFGTLSMPDRGLSLFGYYHPGGSYFQPWQVLTYSFMHFSFRHLFINTFNLCIFGTMLEMDLGAERFSFLYLSSAFAVALCFYFLIPAGYPYPLIGSTAAINGLMGAYLAYYPNREFHLFFFPHPIKVKYLIGVYFLFDIYAALYEGGGIIQWILLLGALMGFAIATTWKKNQSY